MSFQYIRDTYGVPAKRGTRVEYSRNGMRIQGTITGSRQQYLLVRLDGDRNSIAFHPTWNLRYLDAATANDGEA